MPDWLCKADSNASKPLKSQLELIYPAIRVSSVASHRKTKRSVLRLPQYATSSLSHLMFNFFRDRYNLPRTTLSHKG